MLIFYGGNERVRVHERQDLTARLGGYWNVVMSYGGKYGVGTPTRGQEGRRFFTRYAKARRGAAK